MNDTEFNLIDEPWIRVMDDTCKVTEVSLKDVILNAHKYKSLRGELPTQDAAVMRLILAVLHTIISRYDENGEESDLEDDEDEALDRWKAYYDKGGFPEKAVSDYLGKWHERFWLFHPERPFGQIADLNVGTDYEAPKLNGEVSQSGNKTRLFSAYSGQEKSELSYSQAARWLLYLNAYDDTSSKPTKEGKAKAGGNLPSPGAGWLGKLGIIYLRGKNLFETLMLNTVLICEDKVQYTQKPLWEKELISDSERVLIPLPDNLAELYTLQSRRVKLNRDNNKVVSYKLIGGDFFEKENAFFEPMTVWRVPKDDKEPYVPKRHDSTKQMWREFSSMYGTDNRNSRPGVVKWYNDYLYGNSLLGNSHMMKTDIVSVEYGDKDFFVENIFSDSLEMHSGLLSDLGRNWRSDIEIEINHCESVAYAIGKFARALYVSSGGSNSDKDIKYKTEIISETKSQMFFRLDLKFREWLRSIDPECKGQEKQEVLKQWQEIVKTTAIDYAYELEEKQPENSLIGHMVKEKDKAVLYSASIALNKFKFDLKKIYEGE